VYVSTLSSFQKAEISFVLHSDLTIRLFLVHTQSMMREIYLFSSMKHSIGQYRQHQLYMPWGQDELFVFGEDAQFRPGFVV